jgi:hypothetical protein
MFVCIPCADITFCYDGDDDSRAACDNGDCHENNDDALEIKKASL